VQAAAQGQPMPSIKPELRIPVPAEIYHWKAQAATRQQALDVQSRNRELFLQAFGDHLDVLGYERDQQGNGTFLLGRWDETWKY
jgi:hypothetical protein